MHRESGVQSVQPEVLVNGDTAGSDGGVLLGGTAVKVRLSASFWLVVLESKMGECILLVIGAVASGVLERSGLGVARRVIQDLVEKSIGVKREDASVGMLLLERCSEVGDALVEVSNGSLLQADTVFSLAGGERRTLDRGDVQEEEVAGTACVEL